MNSSSLSACSIVELLLPFKASNDLTQERASFTKSVHQVTWIFIEYNSFITIQVVSARPIMIRMAAEFKSSKIPTTDTNYSPPGGLHRQPSKSFSLIIYGSFYFSLLYHSMIPCAYKLSLPFPPVLSLICLILL